MKKLLLSATVMLGLAMLGLASPSFAADRTNYDIYKDVTRQVTGYAFFTIFDTIRADVDDGVVTLTGKVTLPFKSRDIEKRVAKVAGVTAVRNRIEALPVSQMDNQLRMGIARARHPGRHREQRRRPHDRDDGGAAVQHLRRDQRAQNLR